MKGKFSYLTLFNVLLTSRLLILTIFVIVLKLIEIDFLET